MILAALEYFDNIIIDSLAADPEVCGVVLGDLFCNQRMFAGGEAELEETVRQAKAAGLAVWYQTPRYLTDPVYDLTLERIRFWKKHGLIDGVILQDIGLLSELAEDSCVKCSGGKAAGQTEAKRAGFLAESLGLIWGFMGVARNRAENLMHYEYLESLAPVTIALTRTDLEPVFRGKGIPACMIYGHMKYATVNRECYYLYETGCDKPDCGRRCLEGKLAMENKLLGVKMSVNGHLLNKRYEYQDPAAVVKAAADSGRPVLLYAEGMAEFRGRRDALLEARDASPEE